MDFFNLLSFVTANINFENFHNSVNNPSFGGATFKERQALIFLRHTPGKYFGIIHVRNHGDADEIDAGKQYIHIITKRTHG